MEVLRIEDKSLSFPRRRGTHANSPRPQLLSRGRMSKICDPIFTTPRISKGIGLGRATVSSIAKQHKGYSRRGSEPESGSTSEGFLPYVVPAPLADGAPPAQKLENGKVGATILFDDDDASLRDIARIYLEANGYRVIVAQDGKQAVKLWKQHQREIDLVLTDLMMPGGVNGHQLVQRLHVDRPDLKAIFVSGHNADLFGEDVFLDETTNFLQKPYRLKNLADMVRDCLARGEVT
jgi:CheY-like chemotaxis protein